MDTSETGLEKIIVDWLRDHNGYEQETPHAYNKDFALVDKWVERFVTETQPEKVKQSMCFASPSERFKFFTRLANEITKRGVTDVLRKGYKFNGSTFNLYYPLPSELNPSAKVAYEHNIFGVIRQVMYSKVNTNEIDFVVFINGLPLATFELKNNFTGQTYENAIAQYRSDRDPKELLLQKLKHNIMLFGNRIRELRDKQGVLQRQLAALLEIDTPMFSKIERGDRRAKREQVIKLAEYLHQDVKEMLTLWLADKVLDAVGTEDEISYDAITVAQKHVPK